MPISRQSLWLLLSKNGVPSKITEFLEDLHSDTVSLVVSESTAKCQTGLSSQQGCGKAAYSSPRYVNRAN